MTVLSVRRLAIAAALTGVSLSLVGCMGGGTTYGTGKSPGAQTLEDLAGIASLGGSKKEPIDYGPRAAVVAPPPGTPLPPPGTDNASLAANWPKDPDVEAKRFKADMQARYKPGDEQPLAANDPKFRLPPQPKSDTPDPRLIDPNQRHDEAAPNPPAQIASAKKLFADARGLPTDENGQPIRQYLTDPPLGYRQPDPTAPVEIDANAAATKKKFKWPWQQ